MFRLHDEKYRGAGAADPASVYVPPPWQLLALIYNAINPLTTTLFQLTFATKVGA